MSKKYGHNRNTKKKEAWNVKSSVQRPERNARERVDLNPEAFDRLLSQKSVNVKVFRTMYCPNVKSVDGAEHEIDCTICNGSGFVDVEPICTHAVIQQQGIETMAHVEGYVQGNTVQMTFPIGIELQYFTKIELEDFTDIYFHRVRRDSVENGDTDVLKYPACRVNVAIDQNNQKYYQNIDFDIDQNGNIKWRAGRAPADGVIYSIHFEAKVQFRAIAALHVTRFSQFKKGAEAEGNVEHLKYPESWMCTKEFLVKRVDKDNNEIIQGPYDVHTIVED